MSPPHRCTRCNRPVDHLLGYDEDTCMACRTWERAMSGRPNAVREGMHVSNDGATMQVDFWYPRSDDEPKYLQVGLYDVRAADDIRISYDFDRDGYMVEQAWIENVEVPPSPGDKHGYTDEVDRWEEVAFVKAWKLNAEKGMAGPGTRPATCPGCGIGWGSTDLRRHPGKPLPWWRCSDCGHVWDEAARKRTELRSDA